jgi:hypothetical protein
MLAKLGIKAAFCMIPYSYSENEPFQFAPDAGQKLPILTSDSMKSGFTLDSNRYASHLKPSDKRAGLVFPAQITERHEVAWEKYTVFEISFPSLEKYNLNIRVVDSDRDTVINRAANILNMTLLSTDKKIEYPEFQLKDIKINIWIETAYKVFPKEMKKMIEEGVKGEN